MFFVHAWWSLQHLLGLDDAGGYWYLFWSGFFSDIVIFVAAVGWYWHHSCHVNGCYRLGLHKVDSTPYTTCRKHHPAMKAKGTVTLNHIRTLYKKNKVVK